MVMQQIKIHDKTFVPYLEAAQLQQRIAEMGGEISRDYAGLSPLFIGILNGAFMFAGDLFKSISVEATISFVKLASYSGEQSTGKVVTAIGLTEPVKDRHVIILEDIVDTGHTLAAFIPELLKGEPASVKVAALLSKPDARKAHVDMHYTGFEIPDKFVVGYGLDYDGLGRNLADIYQLG
jgi:hypoxanthine phosphoribosyltransferase